MSKASETEEPHEIKTRILGPGDLDVLSDVADGVFDNPIDFSLGRSFLEDPGHHLEVAVENDRVIGMASALHYVHPDKSPELWVNEIGVAPA